MAEDSRLERAIEQVAEVYEDLRVAGVERDPVRRRRHQVGAARKLRSAANLIDDFGRLRE